MINQEQMDNNWTELMSIIDKYFEGEQKENILKLHSDFEDEYKTAPASGRPNYHNCFKGGYLDHILHVIKNSLMIKKLYEKNGVKSIHTDSDVVLAAMFHDLGKLGDGTQPYYKYQTDDWRRKKLNEWFTHNPELQYMSVTDRAIWLLQHFDIKISQLEFLAIKVSDGMYDEANQQYLKTYKPENSFHSSLPYLIHWADHMATRAEYTEWKYEEEYENAGIRDRVQESVTTQVDREVKKVDADPEPTSSAKDLFNELFGE